jgi:hypothetical protein
MQNKIKKYIINYSLTPQDNIINLLKLCYPVELSLAKLNNDLQYDSSHIKFKNVLINFVKNNRYDYTENIENFKRIKLSINIPTNHRREKSFFYKCIKLNDDGTISLKNFKTIFDIYAKKYSDAKEKNDIKELAEKEAAKKLQEIRTNSMLPKGCSIYCPSPGLYNVTVYTLPEKKIIELGYFLKKLMEEPND